MQDLCVEASCMNVTKVECVFANFFYYVTECCGIHF